MINFAYRILLVQAACLVCLAHGSNDVANSIAPLLVELRIVDKNEKFAYWLGGIGISLGLVTLGYRVMETVGKNVIKLDFYKGYSCQFATASCIMAGSYLGIPLSTTHCMVGSLFGIVLCNKMPMVKRAYDNIRVADRPDFNESTLLDIEIETDIALLTRASQVVIEPEKRDENSINFETVKKILLFWGMTVPVAMIVSYSVTKLLLINIPQN